MNIYKHIVLDNSCHGDLWYVCDGFGKLQFSDEDEAYGHFEEAVTRYIKDNAQVVDGYYRVNVHDFSMWMKLGEDKMMTKDIIRYGVYEGPETAFAKKVVSPGMTCFDVGSHIGYYTLLMAGLVGRKGRVCSFEPDDDLRKVLHWNVALNYYNNLWIENMALSDKWGFGNYVKGGSIMSTTGKGRKCKISTIDEYVIGNKIKEVNFIKIDTSGYDCKVLRGASDIIRNNENIVIMMEYNPSLFYIFGDTNLELVEYLRTMGLEVMFITGKKGKEGYQFKEFVPFSPKQYDVPADQITKAYSSDPDRRVVSLAIARLNRLEQFS